MSQTLKRSMIVVLVFAAFCSAGYIATSLEFLHNSIAASSAVFGVSFLSLIGGAIKLWTSIFG